MLLADVLIGGRVIVTILQSISTIVSAVFFSAMQPGALKFRPALLQNSQLRSVQSAVPVSGAVHSILEIKMPAMRCL